MSYTALARTYRPSRFSELVAQQHVAAGLAGAVARHRVAHAYLLTGPRGVGKTTAARILAMALNCERRSPVAESGEPCGECDSCIRIWSGAANLDVVEIDAASNRGVDDARELRERAMYAASGPDRFKVYIVDEAHMLTREAWNALLKILEEPPSRVVFVFATTEPQKIANTAAPVLSRMQRFDFRRMSPPVIAERLRFVAGREGIPLDDDAALLIARVASGGMRDALSILDQLVAFGEGAITAARVREALGLIAEDLYGELLDILVEHRAPEVLPFVARLVEAGADLPEFAAGLGEVLRALLVRLLNGEPEGVTEPVRAAIERDAARLREGDVLRMLKLLAEAEEQLARSPYARLHLETLLLQLSLLDRTVELADVLKMLGGAPQAPAPPPPPASSARQAPAPAETRPAAAEPSPRGPGQASSARPATAAEPPAAARPERGGALTLDRVRAEWDRIVEAVGQKRRMLREALGDATPVEVEANVLTLEVTGSDVHRQGLESGRAVLESAVQEVTGTGVRVILRPAPMAEERPTAGEAKRLDRAAEREERLRRYRAKDAALDVAADAMDLELLE